MTTMHTKPTAVVAVVATSTTVFSTQRTAWAATPRTPPAHLGTGVVRGLSSFGKGLMGGVSGLFLDPVRGAQRNGIRGALQGVGSGLAGVVCKPVAGSLDLVTNTATGILNTPGAMVTAVQSRNQSAAHDQAIQNARVEPDH